MTEKFENYEIYDLGCEICVNSREEMEQMKLDAKLEDPDWEGEEIEIIGTIGEFVKELDNPNSSRMHEILGVEPNETINYETIMLYTSCWIMEEDLKNYLGAEVLKAKK